MAVYFKPITIGSDGKQHVVAPTGALMEPDYIPVSTAGTNLVSVGNDGIYVHAADMVSATKGNLLSVGLDGKLVVEPQEPPDYVSAQTGNYVRYGNDKGVFLDGNDVLSNAVNNLITINPTDGKLQLTEEALRDADFGKEVKVVSADSGNLLTVGTDAGALLAAQNVAVALTGSGLEVVDGKLAVEASQFVDGTTVKVVNDKLSVDLTGLVDGTTVKVVENKLAVDAAPTVAAGDKLLYKTLNNELGTSLSVSYDRVTGRMQFLGVNDAVISELEILGADSVLEDVDFVVDPLGQSPGAYLLFLFRLQNGNAKELYVNMSYLSDVYKAGAGIQIADDLTIRTKLAADGGLGYNVNGELQIDGKTLGAAVLNDIISTDAGNDLKLGADGKLYFSGEVQDEYIPDLVSAAAGNTLTVGLDGKLYVATVKSEDFVSATDNNTLTVGLDGKLYVAPVEPSGLVSAQADNLLTVGLDGKLFAKSTEPDDLVSADSDNLLVLGSDGKLFAKNTESDDLISTEAGNKLRLGSDGLLYADGISAAELITAIAEVVSADTGNALQLGSDGKLFVALDHGTM